MKYGLLQSNLSNSNYEYNQLLSSAKNLGITLVDIKEVEELKGFDFTLNRCYLEKCAKVQVGRQINDFTAGYFYRNKLRQRQLNLTLPTPETIYGENHSFNECRELLGVPFVAKRSVSFGGKGVFLIRSQEDFDNATHCDIFQEMIWNSYGKDLRIFALGGKVLYVMQRNNNQDFRANISSGGYGTKYEIDNDIVQITESIYNQTKLDIKVSDYIIDYIKNL